MVKCKCVYCEKSSSEQSMTTNYKCPFCFKDEPLGRQSKLGEELVWK